MTFVVATEVTPIEKTWDTLEVGDILVDDDGDERAVLGVMGKIVFYSNLEFNESGDWETVTALKWSGWTIKQDTSTPSETVMTIAEIEKKLGIANLKVVKEGD